MSSHRSAGQMSKPAIALFTLAALATSWGQGLKRQEQSGPNGNALLQSTAAVSFIEAANAAGVAGPQLGLDHGSVFADFNGDGLLDLCFTQKEARNFLFINQGNGTFVDRTEAAGLNTRTGVGERIRGTTAADYDNDGDLDLFLCSGDRDVLYRNNGNLTFTDVSGSAGVDNSGNGLVGTWGDYDRDGYVDLYVTNWADDMHALYRNNRDGTFDDVTVSAGLGYDEYTNIGVWLDHDNDGDLDLFVSRWNDLPHRLWRNNGNGSFTNVAAQAGLENTIKGQGAVAADYDNDGYVDIYLGSDLSPNLLYRNNGNGTFSEVGQQAGVADARRTVDCAMGDFDNDGWIDIYTGNYNSNNGLYFNNGNGTFTEAGGVTADYARTIGATLADYDNDGDLDMYTGNSDEFNRLYQNQGNNNHWLQIELTGGASNRSAIGARLEILAGGVQQIREVSGGSGYCNQNALVQSFGLAGNARAQSLVIKWPSGRVESFSDLAADQKLKFVEGQVSAPDTTKPALSAIQAGALTSAGATITWSTDEASDAQVEYGASTSYGSLSTLDANRVSAHAITLSGLAASTTYHYRARSRDAAGNLALSNDFTFTTLTNTGGTGVIFADDFNSDTLNTSNWHKGTNSGNQTVVANNRLELRSNDSQSGWVVTKQNYAARNTTVSVRVTQPNDDGALGLSPTYQASATNGIYDEAKRYRFYVYREDAGNYRLYVEWKKSGAPEGFDVTGNTVITPQSGAYLRLRFDDAQIYFEASLDNVNWSTKHSETFDLPGYNLDSKFYYELAASRTASKGVMILDDFSIVGPGAPIDTQAPVISNVASSAITSASATITWSTDEASDTQVEYGLTTSYGNSTALNPSLVISHSANLSGLNANTTYHYRVKSRDAAGNLATSADFTFTTQNANTLSFTDITLSGGTGGPTDPNLLGGHAAIFSDVNNDARPDLYITMLGASLLPMPDLFFRNNGNNVFFEEAALRGIDDFDGGSHGACFGDLDNDGDYDLYNGTTDSSAGVSAINNIFRNEGNGFFTDVTAASGIPPRSWQTRAVVAFDMEGDGDLDLFSVTDYLGTDDPPGDRNEVYRNDGGLQFTAINSGALFEARAGQGATDTDFDNDGDIDIFAANRTGDVNILRNEGNGVFTQIVPATLGLAHRADDGITSADIDNDGDLDLLLARDDSGTLYRNLGNGTFSFAQNFTATDGYMGGFADLDNDGDLDLVFAGDDVSYLNNGAGNFTAGPSISVSGINDPRAIGFADIDNDGDLDFAFGCKRSRNWLVRNNNASNNWLKLKLISPQGQAGAYGAKTKIYPAGQAGGALLGLRESRSNNGYLGQDDQIVHFGLGNRAAVDVVVDFLDGTSVTVANVSANQTITINGVSADATAPVITQVAASAITETGATITWQTDEIAAAQVEYGVSAALGLATNLDTTLRTSHSLALANLASNTVYYYRAVAIDHAGNRAESQIASFTTLGSDPVPPVIANVSAANVTSTSAEITFTTDRNAFGSAEYDTSAHDSTAVMPLGDSITEGTGSSDDAGYRSGLYALLTDFNSKFDFVGSLQYGIGLPDPEHEGHAGWYANDVLAELKNFLQQSRPEAVLVHIGTNDVSFGDPVVTVFDEITAVVDTILLFNPNTKVYLATLIPRRDNKQNINDNVNAQLPGMVSSRASAGYKIFLVDMAAAFLANPNWAAQWMSDNVHPNDAGYEVMAQQWHQAYINTEYESAVSSNTLATAHNITLTNLSPGSTYHYRARAQDQAGLESASADFTFNTLASDTTPPVIANVSAGNITAAAATITWSTNEASDSQVEYGLSASYGSLSALDTNRVSAHAMTLTGLNENGTYHYRVRSRDASNNLRLSGDYTFVTQRISTDSTVAFDNVQGIFNRNCVRCHQGNPAPAGLVLLAGESHNNIVNVPSTEYPQWLRVHPGNRAMSWLYEKISNSNPAVGSKMENLTPDEIELIGKWIDQGATSAPTPPYAALQFRTTVLPLAEIRIAYSVEVVVWGGLPPYQYALVGGALPPGMTLNASSGAISGAPTATGVFNFTLRVGDAQSPAALREEAYTLEVRNTQASWQAPEGFEIQPVVTDVDMGVNLAFVPNPGPNADDAYFYISSLYGEIIMVQRDFQKRVYAANLLNFNPRTTSGFEELGVDGITVEPITGDVFATLPYEQNGLYYGKVVRFHSADGGRTAATQNTIFNGVPITSSHQVHAVTIGPDGKLYVNTGDGQVPNSAVDEKDPRGKILRMNFDGTRPPDNPYSDSYAFAIGLRNPFGADWRASDGQLYVSDNGTGVNDRLIKVSSGGYYGWPHDLTRGAIHLWTPTVAPTAVDFLEDSGFPASYHGQLFVAWSGPTYAQGANTRGKKIEAFELDENGAVASHAIFLDYVGVGYATVIGLAFGPDGLYFTDLYGENGFDASGYTHGNVYRMRWISGDSAAPVINNVQALDVSSAAATIVWQTDEPSKRQVEYGPTAAYGRWSEYATDLKTSHSVALTGLSPQTTYHYRVWNWDASNNGAASLDFTFTTPGDTSALAVSNVAVSNISTSEAQISWNTNRPADSQVEYGLSASYGFTSALDTAQTTTHSVTLTGLNANTTYHFRVQSRDRSGNLAVSEDSAFTTAPLPTVALHGVYEFTLRSRQVTGNNYAHGPSVSITFQGASGAALGSAMTVQGFWEGADLYRVRFAPDKTGEWSWQTSSSDTGLNSKAGSFRCEGALAAPHVSQRGHVRESKAYPYTFAHADSTPFFLLGDTQWSFATDAITWPTEFQTYVDARAAQGFNYVHGLVYNVYPMGNEGNEGGPIFFSNDVDSLNPGFFRALDQRVAYMNEKGMVVGLMFAWGSSGWQNFAGTEQVDRFMRYVINRYAAHNVFWILAGEYEEGAPVGGYARLGELVASHDVYDHPSTIHTVNTSADDFGSAAWHTTIYQQIFHSGQITLDRVYHKPVINSEYGYEGDQSAEEVRQDAWQIVMRGGFGVYGDTNTFHFNAKMTPQFLNSPGGAFMTVLKNFWTNNAAHPPEWWRFTRFDSSGAKRFLAGRPGVEYVVYADTVGAFTFNLADMSGTINGQWCDTRTGVWGATFSGAANAAYVLTPPDSGYAACLYSAPAVAPPVIAQVQASNVSTSAATITWQTDKPADAQAEFGLSASYGSLSPLDTAKTLAHQITLTNLAPNTLYHYRVRSREPSGVLALSEDFTFTTQPAPPLFADDFNAATLDLNKWQRGTNSENQSAVVNGELELRSQSAQSGWVITKQAFTAQNTTVTVKVTQPNDDGDLGMSPTYKLNSTSGIYGEENWYRFYVYRETPGNYRLYVEWLRAGVQGGLDVTGNLAITAQSGVYLRLRMDATKIYFDASLNGQQWTTTHSETFALPGYTLNDKFYYELAASRTALRGVLRVEDFAIASLAPPPIDTQAPAIGNVAANNITTNSAQITWSTDEASDAQVEYGLTSNYGALSAFDANFTTAHALTLTNLLSDTTYHFRVRSKDAAGNLGVSNNLTFKTLASGSSNVLLADDFNSGALDANKWLRGTNSGNQAAVQSNALQLQSTGAQSGWVMTKQAFVARNTTVAVKVMQPNNDGALGMSPTYNSASTSGFYGENNWYRFYVYREQASGPYLLYAQWSKGGIVNGFDVKGNLAINGPVYLRLRYDNTQIYFEASLDGVIWSIAYQEPFALPGYSLNDAFYYELAAYKTSSNGVLQADDFAITSFNASAASFAKPSAEENPAAEIPQSFALSQNYPNPFNIETRVNLDLPESGHVQMIVYNLQGQEVRRLFDETFPPGAYALQWRGVNEREEPVSAGVYLLRVTFIGESGKREVATRRLVVMK